MTMPRKTFLFTLLTIFAMIGTTVLAGFPTARAGQTTTVDIIVRAIAPDGGGYTGGVCLQLVGFSNVGCDENGDGGVSFAAVPVGTYTVRAQGGLPSGWNMSDQSITVRAGQSEYSVTLSASAPATTGSGDLFISTFYGANTYFGACYQLVGYSNIGCDENGDGYIRFQDVPYGTYLVHQTANISPQVVYDFTINFDGRVNTFYVQAFDSQPAAPAAGTVKVSLITRDPSTGKVITGACYQLVGYSNIGCDENGDGQVDFADIPDGTYTVRQTTTPAGYPTMNDVTIHIQGDLARQYQINRIGIPLVQRANQSVNGSNTFAVVFFDQSHPGPVINGSCAQLRDASNIGCDNDLIDGQVDFIDVAPENVTVDTAGMTTCPYVPAPGGQDYSWININDDISIIYVPLVPTGTCH